jgi:hypothetical protein
VCGVVASVYSPRSKLGGLWNVSFDTWWGRPASARFERLLAHPRRGQRLALDLGEVRELAEVKLNGKSLGVVWSPSFQVNITDAVKPSGNVLEVEVVNFSGPTVSPTTHRCPQNNARRALTCAN